MAPVTAQVMMTFLDFFMGFFGVRLKEKIAAAASVGLRALMRHQRHQPVVAPARAFGKLVFR